MLYHITSATAWEQAQRAGQYTPAAFAQDQGVNIAVDEAIYRQANRITLRQKLQDARAAQARHDLEAAAKLYDPS